MKRLPLPTLLALLALPAPAWAGAEGPGTPQATAANATFLSTAPIPPTGRGVCVIDTGVDTDTDLGPALAGRTTTLGGGGSTDPGDVGAISDTGDPMPKHGTYVAGIIASQVDGKGTSGIWPAAKVFSARVFAGASATSQVDDYRNAIDWCRTQPGVKVINLSLSGLSNATSAQRASLDDKLAEVRGPLYDINVVAAAGNGGSPATVGYPATSTGVFGVGATDAGGVLAAFSNRGVGLDIATFGVDSCVTTNHGTGLATGRGTSYAAPIVSAALAALRSYDPTLTPDQAETLLLDNADTVGGLKVLNVAKAFRADPTVAAIAAAAHTTGLGAPVTSACTAPPVVSSSGGASAAGDAATTSSAPPGNGQTVVVTPSSLPAPVVDVPLAVNIPISAPQRDKPTLRSVTMRRGVLTVRIAGRRMGERVLFSIDGRRFLRASSTLKVRLKSKIWKTIRVQLQFPGARPSRTLVVRADQDF